jgi:uncharacterized membrane protein
MKFKCTIDINKPVEKVVDIFLNPDSLQYTQDGFKSKELISGSLGKEGSKSKLIYEKLELIETILKNDLPDEFLGLYEHKHTTNTMKVWFEALSENSTRYHSEIEYTKFNGVIINILVKLFPSMFKKQVLKWMVKFKDYAEKQ